MTTLLELNHMMMAWERFQQGVWTRDHPTKPGQYAVQSVEWLAIHHGIGHCLGLAHDDQGTRSNNIMKPVQRETPLGVLPPWISDSDRALIRERYRPDR